MKKVYLIALLFFASLSAIAFGDTSTTQTNLQQNNTVHNYYPAGLALYQPTYILPAYYTEMTDNNVYNGNTPWNQRVDRMEFKGQLSFQVPIITHLLDHSSISLNAAYTQLSYWQFYAKSQYFRETNYEPEIFITKVYNDNQKISVGADHNSNGRGGDLERSWNRAYIDYSANRGNWWLNVRPWIPIFQNESSQLHNPNIATYMGYGRIVVSYKFDDKQTLSVLVRNELESGFKRGSEEIDWTFPINHRFNIFVQGFSGYGQSLLEYNHYTNSIGIGLALNNWV